MTVRHPGISPTNDLVAKKIFSNPEITCQFIRDMLDLPAKNVTILEGSNIHVLPSIPYSAQYFYTSIDVLAELDNGTQVIIEIQVHHQNFFINRLWAYLCSQVNQNLEKIRQQEGNTHQSYKHIAPVYAIAIVDSNYFSDDLAFHSFSMREDTTGEVLTITNNGQENHLVKMAFLELKKYRETSKDEVRKPWLEFFGNKPFTQQPERAISQADQLLDY
ncbi:PD-(D/E)XK nuclease family transposase, partial [Streptococcus mitis]|uniref:PD-(D/E)XK nuclease family transposase n=2 Tax=Streptococcus TaxID=1301 RepID=UPI0004AC4026